MRRCGPHSLPDGDQRSFSDRDPFSYDRTGRGLAGARTRSVRKLARVVGSMAFLVGLAACDAGIEAPTAPELEAAAAVVPDVNRWTLATGGDLSSWGTAKSCDGDSSMNGFDGETWIECWCPLGMKFDSQQGPDCYCGNGSSEVDCAESSGTGTGGDPGGDPEGPPGGDPLDDYRKINLTCPLSVVRGSPATCTLTPYPSSIPVTSIQWSSVVPDLAPTKTGGLDWGGALAIETTVIVSFTFEGEQTSLQRNISVETRNWSWSPAGARAGPGVIDSCIPTTGNPSGFMAGESCTALNPGAVLTPLISTQGYTPLQILDSGPNHGIYYVTNPQTTMKALAQVKREYRSDGSTHSVTSPAAVVQGCQSAFGTPIPAQNAHTVNNDCTSTYSTGFSNLVSTIWNHEEKHVNAALFEASKPINNIHAGLEPLASATLANLHYAAGAVITQSGVRIDAASLAVHEVGSSHSFTFYRWNGSGFPVSSVTVIN